MRFEMEIAMLRSTKIIFLVASVVVGVSSCETDDSSGDSTASAGDTSNSGAPAGGDSPGTAASQSVGGGVEPGGGGQAGARTSAGWSGVGGGAAGGGACEDFVNPVECCSVPDHLPCRGLVEADCVQREYCKAVRGIRYDPTVTGEGGASESTYLGCYSFCYGLPQVESCTYEPGAATDCFRVPDYAVPDGWIRVPCSPTDLTQCTP